MSILQTNAMYFKKHTFQIPIDSSATNNLEIWSLNQKSKNLSAFRIYISMTISDFRCFSKATSVNIRWTNKTAPRSSRWVMVKSFWGVTLPLDLIRWQADSLPRELFLPSVAVYADCDASEHPCNSKQSSSGRDTRLCTLTPSKKGIWSHQLHNLWNNKSGTRTTRLYNPC